MATGTGLPTISGGAAVQAEAPRGPSGESLFNAASWDKIARAGEELQNNALGYVKKVQHQAEVGYLADQDVAIERKKIELRDKHANDPAAFDNAWTAYREGVEASTEPWAVNHVKSKLGHAGNEAFSAITSERRRHVQASSQASWNALVDQTSNRLSGMAMAGQLDTPEGQAEVLKYESVVRSGVTSEFIPQEEADRRIGNMFDTARVYNSRGDVEAVFKKNNSPIEAVQRIDEIVRDPNLRISPEKRLSLASKLRADVHAWDAERTHNLKAVNLEAEQLLGAIGSGLKIPDSRIQETVERYKRFGGQAEAAEFLARQKNIEQLSFLGRVSTSEGAAFLRQYHENAGFAAPPGAVKTAMEFFQGRGYTPAQAAGIVGNLVHESGLNPNKLHDNNTGLGIAGHRLERLTAMKQFAAARGKPVNDFQTQLEFIDQELNSSESRAAAAVRAAQTPEQAAAAFLHFERPLGYNPNDTTGSHGYANRVNQAVRLAGGQPVNVSASGSDIAFLAKARTIVEKKVVEDTTAMITNMDNGILPTQDGLNQLLSAAAATNNPGVLQAVGVAARRYQAHRDFGRAPTEEEAGVLNELQQRARTEGLDPQAAEFLTEGVKIHQKTEKALKEDPLSHGYSALAETAGMPVPKPLNMQNPAAFRQGLAERAQWAALTTANYRLENTPVPAFTKAEFAQVNAAYAAGSTDQKLQMLGDMAATLPPDTYRATIDNLGDNKLTTLVGRLAQERPELAREILQGNNLLALDKTGDRSKDVRTALQNKFGGALYPNPADQNAVTDAALAVYASRRSAAGQSYDATDSAAIENAIDAVAGQVIKRNGMRVAVAPGMTGASFTTTLSRLSETDLSVFGGAVDRNGKVFDPKWLGDNAVLKQLEPGGKEYLIGLRDPTAREGFAPVFTRDHSPLVVDMPRLAADQARPPMTRYQSGVDAARAEQAARLQEARRLSGENAPPFEQGAASPKDMQYNILGDFIGKVFGSTDPSYLPAEKIKDYPTSGDVEFAKKAGFYQDIYEPWTTGEVARVIKGSALGARISELTTEEASAMAKGNPVLAEVYAKGALVANRIPIAALGFDPDKTALETTLTKPNVAGAYSPDTDRMFVVAASASTIIHESIHRGLKYLKDNSEEASKIINRLRGDGGISEESIVRYLMAKQAGDPEAGGGDIADKQRDLAIQQFDKFMNAPRARKDLERLTEIAQGAIAKRHPSRGARQ